MIPESRMALPGRRTRSSETFLLELVKPSHYDDDGYVIQWWRGSVPSNSLADLYSLALAERVTRVRPGELGAARFTVSPITVQMNRSDEVNVLITHQQRLATLSSSIHPRKRIELRLSGSALIFRGIGWRARRRQRERAERGA